MNPSDSESDSLLELAEEFAERFRRGERPSLTEYTARHPQLADRIRSLFPALVVMEEFGSVADPPTGRCGGRTDFQSVPVQLGEYRILREVARGGMGIVYEAVQESLGRHVALKVLPAQCLLPPTHLERFRREARAAAKLHHSNIVPVFGVGDEQGVHYYAMQFIQGQGLDTVVHELQRLRPSKAPANPRRETSAPEEERAAAHLSASLAGAMLAGQFQAKAEGVRKTDKPEAAADHSPLTTHRSPTSDSATMAVTLTGQSELTAPSESQFFQSVARVGVQVADALAYAHGQGILHRDIKPSNLLLDTQGVVWITDFGLAKLASPECEPGESDLTHTGDIVGTLRYMAPERFAAQGDPRSDVFSLGLTLYELATLQPAFTASQRPQLIEKMLHEEPPRPRKIDPHVPRDLETIILKAIAKEPEQRYPTASALAEDLRRFVADRPILARRSSWRERTWRWCRRNPAVASLLLLALLLVVAVASVSTVSAIVYKGKSDEAERARGEAEEEGERTRQAERLARLREAEALIGQAHGTRLSRRPGQRFDALAALGKAAAIGRELNQPVAWFDRLRNEAIAALALPDMHITHEFGSWPPGSVSVDLSDDFELYARTDDKGGCTIRRVADDTEVARLPELGEPAHAGFGSGRILAVRGAGQIQVWDLSGAKPVRRFKEPGDGWAFRPDGRLVAVIHGDGSLSVHDVVTGTRLHRLQLKENVGLTLCLHPTEPFLATSSYFRHTVWVYDLRSGAVVASAAPPWPGNNSAAAWSPDGRTLTVPAGDSGTIQQYAFDPAVPALRPIRRDESTPTSGGNIIAYNPTGDRFVSRGWSEKLDLFDAVSGKLLFTTPSQPAASRVVRFDRTAQRVAASRIGDRNDRIGLWSVADGREYRSLVHTGRGESHNGILPAVHPGGRLAAIALTDGLAIFDLETGRELAHLPIGPAGLPSSVCYRGVYFDRKDTLLTNGFEGFFRWPLRPDPAQPARLLMGPPERLPFNPGHSNIAASRDGRVVAQCMWAGYGEDAFAGGWILHPNSPTPRQVDAGQSMNFCSVSPDGRWVAFGAHDDPIKVYDAATGERVRQSPGGQGTIDHHCRFTPDGQWLVTSMDGGRLYAVDTWEPGPQLGPGMPWDVTSELAVLGQTNGIYRLVELATGRELARLEDPEQIRGAAAFTPDGTKLVVAAKNGLRVWDLRRIRAELTKLGLDWDAPPYPPAEEKKDQPPLEVSVDLGSLPSQQSNDWNARGAQHVWRGELNEAVAAFSKALELNPHNDNALTNRSRAYARLGQWEKTVQDCTRLLELVQKDKQAKSGQPRTFWSLFQTWGQRDSRIESFSLRALAYGQLHRHRESQADYEKLLELDSKNALVHNNMSWLLATCPDAKLRDPARAVQLAQRAVELEKQNGIIWNTLGVAQYRAGDWKAAIEALDKSREYRKGGDAFDFFFLAMAYWRLGQKDDARQWNQRAVEWVEKNSAALAKNPQSTDELRRFRVEAEELLGLKNEPQRHGGTEKEPEK